MDRKCCCAVVAAITIYAVMVWNKRWRLKGKIILKYFDIPALGEPIRMLLTLGGLEWVDERIEFEDWPAVKKTCKWGQVPVLLVGSCELTQTKAICRYLAKTVRVAGRPLYPEDPFLAFEMDEFIEAFEDVRQKYMPTMKITDMAEKMRARAALFGKDGECAKIVRKIDEHCGKDGYMVGSMVTLADVWCFFFFKLLKCGFLDGIPVHALDSYANLLKVERRVGELPAIRTYYTNKANGPDDPEGFYKVFAQSS